ncbi:NADPH-dependent FMN reductase [Rufibacter glacialis]|uniref:NAD(P)H-dependent oxidoreductase n=1 Tax=Rufibacter glacialis TaxID=1259555 RepID=A0A5M8QEE1_9BACT|nr:NAD(P)H-dependent oxidoreductase [Rufibacter glacialis]KAA6433461.1 NAD(P)H-dependent oxidoreductase [Rufibacter glacialis]GGK74005.1 FMN reductase [Rufibacter glacialis]
MKLVVVSGSARPQRQSHQVALEVGKRLEEKGHTVHLLDVRELNFPLLEAIFDKTPTPSEKMKETSAAIAQSEGLLLVSPEYNGSYSGALKNTLDYFYKEYSHKPFGIVGVSSGMLGGINAAKSLQQYALALKGIVLPNVLLTPKVQTLFQEGQLIDTAYAGRLDEFLNDFLWLSQAIRAAQG